RRVLDKRPPTNGPIIVAYRPYSGLTPTSTPLAMPSGTLATARLSPATTSCCNDGPRGRCRRAFATASRSSRRPGCAAAVPASVKGASSLSDVPPPSCARVLEGSRRLLLDQRNFEPLCVRYLVISVTRVVGDLDVDPMHVAREAVDGVVARHRRTGVGADLERFVAGKWERLGSLNPSLADAPMINRERHRSALGRPAAVVLKIHEHLVRSRRHTFSAPDVKEIDPVEVVAVLQAVFLHVERPSTRKSTLRNDDAVAAGGRHLDLCGHAM